VVGGFTDDVVNALRYHTKVNPIVKTTNREK